jgi:hypothetical protein
VAVGAPYQVDGRPDRLPGRLLAAPQGRELLVEDRGDLDPLQQDGVEVDQVEDLSWQKRSGGVPASSKRERPGRLRASPLKRVARAPP